MLFQSPYIMIILTDLRPHSCTIRTLLHAFFGPSHLIQMGYLKILKEILCTKSLFFRDGGFFQFSQLEQHWNTDKSRKKERKKELGGFALVFDRGENENFLLSCESSCCEIFSHILLVHMSLNMQQIKLTLLFLLSLVCSLTTAGFQHHSVMCVAIFCF